MSKKRGHNEGSITKRKDGRWQGAVTVGRNSDGSQKRQYVYGKTRYEVAQKVNELVHSLNTGDFIDKSKNPTVADWLPYWLDTYKKNNIKPKTFDQYEGVVRYHIIPQFGDVRLIDLKEDMLQKFYNKLSEDGLSARTIHIINTVLHASLKKAMKLGLVRNNVTEDISLPKKAPKERRVLTRKEQEMLLDELKKDDLGAMYIVALFTGMRRGEVLALTWEDIDFDSVTIRINKTLSRVKTHDGTEKKTKLAISEPKTEKSKRTIPIVDSLIPLLEKQKKRANNNNKFNLVFPSESGGYIDPGNYNRHFYKIIERTGIPRANPHALRHSFATRALETGIDIKVLQEVLGHNSIDITMDIYAHVLTEHKRKELKKLKSVFRL